MQNDFSTPLPSKVETPRPDVDFGDDLQQIVRNYAPLQMSRQYFSFQVQQGVVKAIGNVRSSQAKWMLIERVPKIDGVKSVNVDELYDDEAVTVAIASHLPAGVYATVYYGMVALTGTLPPNTDQHAMIAAIESTPGVRKVTPQFDQR